MEAWHWRMASWIWWQLSRGSHEDTWGRTVQQIRLWLQISKQWESASTNCSRNSQEGNGWSWRKQVKGQRRGWSWTDRSSRQQQRLELDLKHHGSTEVMVLSRRMTGWIFVSTGSSGIWVLGRLQRGRDGSRGWLGCFSFYLDRKLQGLGPGWLIVDMVKRLELRSCF